MLAVHMMTIDDTIDSCERNSCDNGTVDCMLLVLFAFCGWIGTVWTMHDVFSSSSLVGSLSFVRSCLSCPLCQHHGANEPIQTPKEQARRKSTQKVVVVQKCEPGGVKSPISQQSCERNPSRSRGGLEDRVRQEGRFVSRWRRQEGQQ